MMKRATGVAILLALLAAVGAGAHDRRAIPTRLVKSARHLKAGAVYVLTNRPANALAARRELFDQRARGQLEQLLNPDDGVIAYSVR